MWLQQQSLPINILLLVPINTYCIPYCGHFVSCTLTYHFLGRMIWSYHLPNLTGLLITYLRVDYWPDTMAFPLGRKCIVWQRMLGTVARSSSLLVLACHTLISPQLLVANNSEEPLWTVPINPVTMIVELTWGTQHHWWCHCDRQSLEWTWNWWSQIDKCVIGQYQQRTVNRTCKIFSSYC